MIKLIISDFDGVLLDLKEIHFDSLNMALETVGTEYVISHEEHVKTFDGLSTKKKLGILSKVKGFPADKYNEVNDLKQKFTVELLEKFSNLNHDILRSVKDFKNKGLLFYVASNAIRNTVDLGLDKLGITELVDKVYSNQDVKNAKPSPEMYLKCMIDAGVSPYETLIIEDSRFGRESAVRSGAHVFGVDDSFGFNADKILSFVDGIKDKPVKWAAKSNTNVLIPMAGMGSRFAQVGYTLPKPLIDVAGIPMIQRVVENINIDANYIFVVQREHFEKYNLQSFLKAIVPDCQIVLTNGLTEGAACTTLLAEELIDSDNHLIICNSDQLIEWDSCDSMYSMLSSECDGGILTFHATESKWSYVRKDANDFVCEVAEKKVISNEATVGFYYYKHGSDYVRFAKQMIAKDIRVNNEFYVCPVYNEMIEAGKKIKSFSIEKMWGVGTPEDLKAFLENL